MEEKITIEMIDYLSDLSKLRFSEEEKNVLRDQVTDIIDMLKGMNEIALDATISRDSQSLNDLRVDDIEECMESEDVFSATSHSCNGYFEVPKVVD